MDFDKLNFVKLPYVGTVLGLSRFSLLLKASKNNDCFKSGQKKSKNNILAFLDLVTYLFILCITGIGDLTSVLKRSLLYIDATRLTFTSRTL